MHSPGYASPSPTSPAFNAASSEVFAAAHGAPLSKIAFDEERGASSARGQSTSVQTLFILASTFALVMLVVMPVWNCMVLISSEVYSFLLGRQLPVTIISCMAVIILGYLATTVGFFRVSRREAQSAQSLVMIGGATLTLLGIAFMLLGHALSDSARDAAQEVDVSCRSGPTTSALFREAGMLYVLRFQPACATMASVEMCNGYEQTTASQVLKSMELGLRCSTFCSDPLASVGNASATLPRTLFSEANFQASCHTVLVRNLRTFVGDMGQQTYYQGCMLVIVAIVMNALQLLGMCAPARHPKPANQGYPGVYGTM